jgi:hypothetical protein
MEFQVKLTENLISKYHVTEGRTLGRLPEIVPLTRMNAPHYPSYIAATVSNKIHVSTVLCTTTRVKVIKQGTTAKTVA